MIAMLCAGAALGGTTRFLLEYVLPPVGTSGFPRATLLVNLIGSFVLGLVVSAPHNIQLVVGTGVCGALTTFSGVALQSHRRIAAGAWKDAIGYITFSVVAGVALAWLGVDLSPHVF